MEPVHPHRVAVVVLPGVIALEFGTATQVFGWDPHYELTVCAEDRAVAVPGSGFSINTSAGLEGLKRAETVIVPGYADANATVSTAVLDALQAAHARAARVVSICSGAFALAAAGLLDGRPATTHWQESDRVRRQNPSIDGQPNRVFIDPGGILTAARRNLRNHLGPHHNRIHHRAPPCHARPQPPL